MSKNPGYEITKKINSKDKPKKNFITIFITEKNLEHLEKCLEDQAFISSISKLIFKENPNEFSIRIGVTTLINL